MILRRFISRSPEDVGVVQYSLARRGGYRLASLQGAKIPRLVGRGAHTRPITVYGFFDQWLPNSYRSIDLEYITGCNLLTYTISCS